MAYVTSVTLGTSQKVSVDYQSQEVTIQVTYQLERDDADLLAFVQRKAEEVEKAYRALSAHIREQRAAPPSPAQAPPAAPAARRSDTPCGAGAAPSPPAGSQRVGPETVEEATGPQRLALRSLAQRAGMTDATFSALLQERFGKHRVEELTRAEAGQFLQEMQRGAPEPVAA